MTYGPTNYGSYYSGPVTGGQSQRREESVPEPVPGGPGAKLLAGTSPNQQVVLILGIVVAVLSLLVIVGSFLPWQALSASERNQPIVGNSVDVAVTGIGQVNTEISTEGMSPRQERSARTLVEDIFDGRTTPAGGWTLAFGIVALLCSVPLIIRRYQGIGALAATAFGLAATVCAIVFISLSGSGVVDSEAIDEFSALFDNQSNTSLDVYSTFGLWIVLFASVLLFVTSVAAVILVATAKAGGVGNPFSEGEDSSVQFFSQSNVGFGTPQTGFPPPFPFGGPPQVPGPEQGFYGQPAAAPEGYAPPGANPAEFLPLENPGGVVDAGYAPEPQTQHFVTPDPAEHTQYAADSGEQGKPEQ